ncbi:MAG: DUF2905 family protein [Cyclobacteriaceae bacterium]|nr:DUF2905 family protein [Cyclobacteriaceae bacterium]
MGNILNIIGAILIIIGIIIHYTKAIPWLRKHGSDIVFRRGNFSIQILMATIIVAGLLLLLMIYLINRYK